MTPTKEDLLPEIEPFVFGDSVAAADAEAAAELYFELMVGPEGEVSSALLDDVDVDDDQLLPMLDAAFEGSAPEDLVVEEFLEGESESLQPLADVLSGESEIPANDGSIAFDKTSIEQDTEESQGGEFLKDAVSESDEVVSRPPRNSPLRKFWPAKKSSSNRDDGADSFFDSLEDVTNSFLGEGLYDAGLSEDSDEPASDDYDDLRDAIKELIQNIKDLVRVLQSSKGDSGIGSPGKGLEENAPKTTGGAPWVEKVKQIHIPTRISELFR